MTVTHVRRGYAEDAYATTPYLMESVEGYLGMQVTATIEASSVLGVESLVTIETNTPYGVEALGVIEKNSFYGIESLANIETSKYIGIEADANITNQNFLGIEATGFIGFTNDLGLEALGVIENTNPLGVEALGQIVDIKKPVGLEVLANIVSTISLGIEAKSDSLSHTVHNKYLTEPYGETSYLTTLYCANMPMQVNGIIQVTQATAVELLGIVENNINALGVEAKSDTLSHTVHGTGNFRANLGIEAKSVLSSQLGIQVTSVLYKDSTLRILCNFVSRGTGPNNWTATSTEPGDFSVQNLNTDIPEQVWRSETGTITSINLDCDTGIPQGVSIDTLFIDNHNFTSSASVTLQGDDNSGFSSPTTVFTVQITTDRCFAIAAEGDVPLQPFRFYRLAINDPTNTEGFIKIGIVAFGAANVFSDECFTDEIFFERRDFADRIPTEGFTNVSNSRALRNILGLEFRSLDVLGRSYGLLDTIFESSRTTQKCLWIPVPSPTNQKVTKRYATFGKLTEMPKRTHNSKGPDLDFATFNVNVDESQ